MRLKIEILWGKICKSLSLSDEEKIKNEILELIELFSSEVQEEKRERKALEEEMEEMKLEREEESREKSEQYWTIAENNARL